MSDQQTKTGSAGRATVGCKDTMTYLKFLRLCAGLTQAQLAKLVGISQSAYCEYERGNKLPRPRTHKKLADALDVDLEIFTARLYGIDAQPT